MKFEVSNLAIPLAKVPAGSLFLYGETLAFKSEYRTDKGACECFIYGSGEMFWGGMKTADALNQLLVTPLTIVN